MQIDNILEDTGLLDNEHYFTSMGTSLVYSTDQDKFTPSIYLQCGFDQRYVEPVTKRRYLNEIGAENVVDDFVPALTEACPQFHGIANPFVNKFQGKKCVYCKDLYDYAIAKEEATGVR